MNQWFARLGLVLISLSAPSLCLAWDWFADDPEVRVQVREPFMQWHSGPGRNFPVVHVSERGEWVILSTRKTQWLKVQDNNGREGWAHIDDILLTADATGDLVSIKEPRFDDFSTRRWEAGVSIGQFGSTVANGANVGFWMTENLALELSAVQALGTASETRLYNLNLTHQTFPQSWFSPYFTLGGGRVDVKPKATLVNYSSRSDDQVHAGIGARLYITDRYFVRMEVKDYKIFTDRETNEEVTEWKIGLSVFF